MTKTCAIRFILSITLIGLFLACTSPTVPNRVEKITLSPATIDIAYSTSVGTETTNTIVPSVEPSSADDSSVVWSWVSSDTTVAVVTGVLSSVTSGQLMGAVVAPASPHTAGSAIVSLTATLADGTTVTSNNVTVTVTAQP